MAAEEISIRLRLQGARQMAQQTKAAGQAMQSVGQETAQAGSKARKSAKDFDVVGKAMDGLKKFGVGAGVAAGGALSAGLLSAVNADSANNKLSAQLGLTGPMAARAGTIAGDLYGGAYGDSIEQVNQGLGAVMSSMKGMATASDAELKKVTGTALNFAQVFGTDVESAAKSAGLVMKSGLAKDGTEAFDLLITASRRVPAALRGDLLEASDEYSTYFGQMGFTGQEAFSLLLKGAEQGQYGIDKTGDAIKEFTILATDMSASTKDAYAAIGLDADTMRNKILAGGPSARGASQEIVKGLLGIKDPAEQAKQAIALFGAPLEDLGTENIPDFLKALGGGSTAMNGFAGAGAALAAAIEKGPTFRFTQLKRAIEMFIGTNVIPFVLRHKEAFGLLGVAIGGILLAYGALRLVTMAGAVATGVATAAQWLFGGSLIATRVGLGLLAVQAGVMTAAQWLLNTAMRANPLMLIVTGLMLLAAGFVWAYKNIGVFRAGVQAVWSWIKGNWPLLLAILTGPIGLATLLIIRNWDRIKGAASSVVSWVKGRFGSLAEFIRALPGRIRAGGARMWDWLVTSTRRAVDWVLRKLDGLIDFAKSIPSRVGGAAVDLVGGSALGAIPGMAAGGVVGQSGPTLVGERGPEVVHLSRGAYVESTQSVASRGPDRVDMAGLAASLPGAPARRDERGVTIVVDAKVLAKITGKQVADQLARR